MSKIRAWTRPLKPDKFGSSWQYWIGSASEDVWAFGATRSEGEALRIIADEAAKAGVLDLAVEQKAPFGRWASDQGTGGRMSRHVIDPHRLNEARWAACNTRWIDGHVPTMEKATEVADNAVRAYLGLLPEEWDEALAEVEDD